MPLEWNFADVWESVAGAAPGHIAQSHGGERVTWREFDGRANGIAWTLLQAGCRKQEKVALYLRAEPSQAKPN